MATPCRKCSKPCSIPGCTLCDGCYTDLYRELQKEPEMFEFAAKYLEWGDEFTVDHGETWHKVTEIDDSQDPLLVITERGLQLPLSPEAEVIVR
jgi:hypothetical protein